MRNDRFFVCFRVAIHSEQNTARFSVHLAIFVARILPGSRIRMGCFSLRIQISLPDELYLYDTRDLVIIVHSGTEGQGPADTVDFSHAAFLLRISDRI